MQMGPARWHARRARSNRPLDFPSGQNQIGLVAAWLLSLLAIAAGAMAQTAPVSELHNLIAQAEQHEQAHHWLSAAAVYVQLVERDPDNVTWREALRRCLTQERIRQRYQDTRLRAWLGQVPLADALAVYGEFLEYAERLFFGKASAATMWRRSCEQLDWALDNPAFVELAFDQPPDSERKQRIRELLRQARAVEPQSFQELLQQLGRQARRLYVREQMRPVLTVWECLAASCEALDAYGEYLTPTAWLLEKMLADPHTATPGLEISASDRGLVVAAVVPGSDAARSGVPIGSRLIAVDGEPVQQESLEGVWLRLLGRKGSTVAITVITPAGQTRQWTLSRGVAMPASLSRLTMLDAMHGVAYVRIESFQPGTVREFDRALQELSSQGMRALVLDLRSNRGGLVRAALELADRFIPEGTLAVLQSRLPESSHQYLAQRGEDWYLPVVVLVDKETASAAEILAGALQAHARTGRIPAVIVGQPTRGKGEVQLDLPLASGQAGASRMTVAQWILPDGEAVSGRGLQPDVLVKPTLPGDARTQALLADESAMQQAVEHAILEVARREALRLLKVE